MSSPFYALTGTIACCDTKRRVFHDIAKYSYIVANPQSFRQAVSYFEVRFFLFACSVQYQLSVVYQWVLEPSVVLSKLLYNIILQSYLREFDRMMYRLYPQNRYCIL